MFFLRFSNSSPNSRYETKNEMMVFLESVRINRHSYKCCFPVRGGIRIERNCQDKKFYIAEALRELHFYTLPDTIFWRDVNAHGMYRTSPSGALQCPTTATSVSFLSTIRRSAKVNRFATIRRVLITKKRWKI